MNPLIIAAVIGTTYCVPADHMQAALHSQGYEVQYGTRTPEGVLWRFKRLADDYPAQVLADEGRMCVDKLGPDYFNTRPVREPMLAPRPRLRGQ